MILETLAAKLASQGVGTVGGTIFVHNIPATVFLGIVLRSPLSGTRIDYELPGYRRATFQLVVRCKAHAEGLALANLASAALTLGPSLLTGASIKYCRPRHEPVVYPVTDGGNLEYSVNFDLVYVIVP